jgi:hypothetical protein
MHLHITLHSYRDADLMMILKTIPNGERAAKIRDALTARFVKAPEIAQAIHRLADVLEAKAIEIPVSSTVPIQSTETASALAQKEAERQTGLSLFKNFGAFDDD